MRTHGRRGRAAATVVAVGVAALLLPLAAPAAQAAPPAPAPTAPEGEKGAAPEGEKGAAPEGQKGPAPEGEERSAIIGTPKLTALDLQKLAAKDAAAKALQSGERKAAVAAGIPCPDGDCSWISSTVQQQSQINGYYCGPATLASLVGVRGVSISQQTAASALGTTTNGTDWYNGSTYPMQAALNRYLGPHGAYYAPVSLPGSPTQAQKDSYKSRLQSNTRSNWGTAGDAWEVTGGAHLVGHPNRTIYHWVAIKGYGDWGNQTHYADSVAGASSISWSSGVPAYSYISSDTIMRIMGGRGYIW